MKRITVETQFCVANGPAYFARLRMRYRTSVAVFPGIELVELLQDPPDVPIDTLDHGQIGPLMQVVFTFGVPVVHFQVTRRELLIESVGDLHR